MIEKSKIFCILILLSLSGCESISVHIVAKGQGTSKVWTEGTSAQTISDLEEKSFKLSNESLIAMANKHNGQQHENCYTRVTSESNRHAYEWNPEPNQKVRYKISPVFRVVEVTSTKINIISSELVTVLKKTYTNSKETDIKTETYIEKFVNNKITSQFIHPNPMIDIVINYEFELGDEKVIQSSPQWGENINITKPIELFDGLNKVLKPGETLVAELQAEMVTAEVEINIDAYLNGNVVCYTKHGHGFHNFYTFVAKRLLTENNLPWRNDAIHKFEIVYYWNSRVKLARQ